MGRVGMFKNSWIIWIMSVGIISLLFILSSTDLIVKEDQVTIYQIATILDETSDVNILSFRKGMERAATELKADIRVIPLFEYGNLKDQESKIHYEINNGIAAIILKPVETEHGIQDVLGKILEKESDVPITLYDSKSSFLDYVDIGIDYKNAGDKMGAAIGIEKPNSKKIIFFYTGEENQYNNVFYESCKTKLESLNHTTELFYGDVKDNYDFRIKISQLSKDQNSKPIIICMDRLSLDISTRILESLPSYKEQIGGLYGMGSSTYLLSKLGDHTIDGLIVWNEFAAGYMAVQKTIEQLESKSKMQDEVLESYYIRSNDLENRNFMKVLFPLQ